ncbi:MAG: DUF1345 domain-containing protein [Brachybacterium sp.]|nr:DUF1345 domain-containing protein [Brachybacterium sp.]
MREWLRRCARWVMRTDLRRSILAVLLALYVGMPLTMFLPNVEYVGLADDERRAPIVAIIVVVIAGLTSLFSSILTHLALRTMDRADFLAQVRVKRIQTSSRRMRWMTGRTTARSEAVQLIILTAVVIFITAMRPPDLNLAMLLTVSIGAVIATWIGCVVSFAVEYAAIDAHCDGFEFSGDVERRYPDYLYGAVLLQTSASPSGMRPLSAGARRSVQAQAVLAQIMNTVILALGVSVVVTTLSG